MELLRHKINKNIVPIDNMYSDWSDGRKRLIFVRHGVRGLANIPTNSESNCCIPF